MLLQGANKKNFNIAAETDQMRSSWMAAIEKAVSRMGIQDKRVITGAANSNNNGSSSSSGDNNNRGSGCESPALADVTAASQPAPYTNIGVGVVGGGGVRVAVGVSGGGGRKGSGGLKNLKASSAAMSKRTQAQQDTTGDIFGDGAADERTAGGAEKVGGGGGGGEGSDAQTDRSSGVGDSSTDKTQSSMNSSSSDAGGDASSALLPNWQEVCEIEK